MGPSSAQSDSKRAPRAQVIIDTARRSPLRRIWRYVGYDECNYTYTTDGKDLLAKLGSMTDSPYFIRTHFMLCSGDGTGSPKWGFGNIYTEDAEGNPAYDWDIIARSRGAPCPPG